MSRDEELKYLADLRSFFITYHNHKEVCAWAGVALFMALLPFLVTALERVTGPGRSSKWFSTTILALLIACVVVYVHEQFALRRFAANINAASFYLTGQCLAGELKAVNPSDFRPAERLDPQIMAPRVLPQFVLDTAERMSKSGQGRRKALERAAYGLISLGAFLAILAIWHTSASNEGVRWTQGASGARPSSRPRR